MVISETVAHAVLVPAFVAGVVASIAANVAAADPELGARIVAAWPALVLVLKFLDIGHQFELLDLCADLHHQGRTLVAVLHDLNQACRYATHLIAMGPDGRIAATGAPGDIVSAELVKELFGLPCRIVPDPEAGTPMIIPCRRTATRS